MNSTNQTLYPGHVQITLDPLQRRFLEELLQEQRDKLRAIRPGPMKYENRHRQFGEFLNTQITYINRILQSLDQ